MYLDVRLDHGMAVIKNDMLGVLNGLNEILHLGSKLLNLWEIKNGIKRNEISLIHQGNEVGILGEILLREVELNLMKIETNQERDVEILVS